MNDTLESATSSTPATTPATTPASTPATLSPATAAANTAPAALLQAAARLEQPLGALADAMAEVERIALQIGHSTYMHLLVAERARYARLHALTATPALLAESLATRGCVHQMLQLLAPALVFPAATPMQADFSGEMLHRARRVAELHKENLRKMIASEAARLALDGAPAADGKCADTGEDAAP